MLQLDIEDVDFNLTGVFDRVRLGVPPGAASRT
jgi:hypothetical protein